MKYLLVFSLTLFGCTVMDNSDVSHKPKPEEPDYTARPPLTSTEVCMGAFNKGTDCKLSVSSSPERFVSFCKSDPGIVAILRRCVYYNSCEAFQRCSKFAPIKETPKEPEPTPEPAKTEPAEEEPDKPNPKFVLCDNLQKKLKSCFKPEELTKIGTDMDGFLFNCNDEVLPNYNKEKNFIPILECHMKDASSDCPTYQKCVFAGIKKIEEDRVKAEKEAAEAERKAFEAQKAEYQKKPFFKAKKRYCTIGVSIFQSCSKYAYMKVIQEQKVTNSQLIDRCLYNEMDEEPDEEKWKNWAFCFDKTGTNCKEFNTCVSQVD